VGDIAAMGKALTQGSLAVVEKRSFLTGAAKSSKQQIMSARKRSKKKRKTTN
jgi:hypothetical protein